MARPSRISVTCSTCGASTTFAKTLDRFMVRERTDVKQTCVAWPAGRDATCPHLLQACEAAFKAWVRRNPARSREIGR